MPHCLGKPASELYSDCNTPHLLGHMASPGLVLALGLALVSALQVLALGLALVLDLVSALRLAERTLNPLRRFDCWSACGSVFWLQRTCNSCGNSAWPCNRTNRRRRGHPHR